MKIGIYSNRSSLHVGGGHVFEDKVISDVRELGNGINHEFILLLDNQSTDEFEHDSEYINLDIYAQNKLDQHIKNKSIINKIIRFIATLVGKNKKILRLDCEYKKDSKIQYLYDLKIDMLLYLKQGDVITYDIPYVTIVWDLEHRIKPYFPEVSSNRIWQKREDTMKLLLQRASKIITGTQTGLRNIVDYYNVPQERVLVNRMPVPKIEDQISDVEVKKILGEYKFENDYIFYPAQFWPHKNHITLLKVIRYLKQNYNLDYDLVLTGSDRGNMEYIRQVAKEMEISDYVYFPGFVSRKDLAALYSRAFCLCYPTYFGPDNLPPLEAFKLGCPVISSDIEGASEQLGDAAILVNVNDEVAIAKAIIELRENGALRETKITAGYNLINQYADYNYMENLVEYFDEFQLIRETWSSENKYLSVESQKSSSVS